MRYFIFAFLFLLTFSPTSFAQVETPKMFSIQAVLIDGGGNVLYDLQETDINFKIIDGGGNVYYEEVQHVYMVNGAMSTLIGRGVDPATGQPTGGIPYEALEPDADRLIRFKLVDHTVPQEDMQIVSVPYAYYSEFADTLMEPLIGDLIANEAITLAHVSPELKNYIDNAIDGISKQDLQDHITGDKAHDAKDIVVSTPLKYSGGNTVDKALHEFDMVLEIWANKDGLFEKDITNITNKVTGLEDGTTLDPRYVNVTGDAMTGNLDMGNNNITNINQITATTVAGDGGGITNISGTNVQEGSIASQQIKDGSIATTDLANTNISQWTNDSKYITDGNTGWENDYGFIKDGNEGWDNTYGFITDGNQGWGNDYGFITDGNQGWGNEYGLITDGNQGWENEYGLITDGNQNWNNEYGFITQADLEEVFVNENGDTMSGGLNMGQNDITNITSGQHSITEIVDAIWQIQCALKFQSKIKNDACPVIPDVEPLPPQPEVVAWLKTSNISDLTSTDQCSPNSPMIVSNHNVKCIVEDPDSDGVFSNDPDEIEIYTIYFDKDEPNTDYVVLGNAAENSGENSDDLVTVLETTKKYFRVRIHDPAGGGSQSDFMVAVIRNQ